MREGGFDLHSPSLPPPRQSLTNQTYIHRPGPRVLIFNQQGRSEAIDFLDGLHAAAKRPDGTSFDRVMFCTNVTYAETGYKRGTCICHIYFTPPPPNLPINNPPTSDTLS